MTTHAQGRVLARFAALQRSKPLFATEREYVSWFKFPQILGSFWRDSGGIWIRPAETRN